MQVWLPHIVTDDLPYDTEWISALSVSKLVQNIEYLLANVSSHNLLVSYINSLWQEYRDVFFAIAGSRWIHKDEELRILTTTNLSSNQTDVNRCQQIIPELCRDGDRLIFLSDSHTSTVPVIRACKEQSTNMKIGVFCIDAHADLYTTSEPLWKGNILSTLFEESCIQSIVFLGVPVFRQKSILSEITPTLASRLAFINWPYSNDQIVKALQILTDNEITHVYFSVDLDGLDTRYAKYTALEYCPFQILANLAHIDFYEKDILTTLEGAIRPPGRKMKSNIPSVKNLLYAGDEGISIDNIPRVFDCALSFFDSHAMVYGLEYHGCRISGDIVELFGVDFDRRTAKTVCRLIEILSSR